MEIQKRSEPTAATAMDRRDFLAHAGSLAVAAVLFDTWARPGGASAATSGPDDLRVYVIAIHSLDPVEVTTDLMPSLSRLRANGIWYESVSVLPASSVQNYAAIVTGALPQTNGFVHNELGCGLGQKFSVDHIFTRLANEKGSYAPGVVKTFWTSDAGFMHLQAADAVAHDAPPGPETARATRKAAIVHYDTRLGPVHR